VKERDRVDRESEREGEGGERHHSHDVAVQTDRQMDRHTYIQTGRQTDGDKEGKRKRQIKVK